MANQPKKYKKFVATAATATLVASAIVPVASAASLSDIKGNTHEEAITSLVDAGVINGYPDGTFQPNKTLTRSDVVKLLGKYLVSKGLEVPADYKTNVRFNDLTSASNDELLKYAAVVYDAGVFSGSNGNLLAGDNITRENMAVVLVRAFDTLNNIDLVSYVQGEEYKKDVKDLFTAKAEARAAIEVLDFFDITNPSVANFNPKGSTTRGQFATFLYKTINTDFSAVTGVANSAVSEIKAVNNTTVEVTFKDAVDNIEALDFTIEGLEVKNAVVKQTDAKTVVLTTAAQTGDKVYTLNVNAAKAGTFKGISAVVPTAIKLTTPSVQGTIGQQVTVKAEVTVPAGQSKAGIPVTFNIVNDNVNLNEKIEVVAYTNEEGVATYTYTRYYKNNDSVTAYATDKSSVFASGKVYWAEGLTITEVTTGNELANGAKKVYKIKTGSTLTETNGTAVTTDDYKYVNVAFLENVDVTPDKLVRDVEVIDTGVASTTTYTQAKYPSQVTTGGIQTVRVKVDANGEATFTLTGSNATVTPVVFVDNTSNVSGKYTTTALQAAAPAVKFALSHTLGLTVKAEGVQNAAGINANGIGTGGRDYTVTVTDKAGKLAPEGTLVHVVFPEGSFSTDRTVYFTSKANGTSQIVKDALYTAKVGKEGQATFTLTGNKDGFVEPTVFINNGSDDAKLDKSDLQTVGEKTFFVNAVINSADLIAEVNGQEVTTTSGSNTVDFIYTSVDQNGKKYAATPSSSYEVSYEVTAQFGDVYAGPSNTLVKKGTTSTIKVNASNGVANLQVRSVDPSVASQVTVNASASQLSLPNKAVTVNFTNSLELPATHTGYVTKLDTTNEKITLDHYNPVSYDKGTYFNDANQQISKSQFVTALQGVTATNKAQITATKQADGTFKFNIISLTVAKTSAEILAESKATLATKVADANAKVQSQYTAASWAAFTTARTAAAALAEGTQAEVNTKIAAYDAAVALLVTNASEEAAQQAATARLNAAKTAAASKVEATYTTASWTALKDALAIADGTTANQKNTKAAAIETAIAKLVSKASFAGFTITVDDTDAATGELLLTFSETSPTPVTTFEIATLSNVTGAVTGTVATATPGTTPDNTVLLTVTDGAAAPTGIDLTAVANTGATYTFTATVTKADFFAKDVVVEVKFDGTDWVAAIK